VAKGNWGKKKVSGEKPGQGPNGLKKKIGLDREGWLNEPPGKNKKEE